MLARTKVKSITAVVMVIIASIFGQDVIQSVLDAVSVFNAA